MSLRDIDARTRMNYTAATTGAVPPEHDCNSRPNLIYAQPIPKVLEFVCLNAGGKDQPKTLS